MQLSHDSAAEEGVHLLPSGDLSIGEVAVHRQAEQAGAVRKGLGEVRYHLVAWRLRTRLGAEVHASGRGSGRAEGGHQSRVSLQSARGPAHF